MIQNIIESDSASDAGFAVREVCTALEVSPSGFYAHRQKDARPRYRQDHILLSELQSAFEQSFSTYGSPRLVRALRERGLFTSKTRVCRLMKLSGLCPQAMNGTRSIRRMGHVKMMAAAQP